VSPPKAGKTILMQKLANSIIENHPEVYLIVLLIDERPEEVTDMEENVKGPNVEVVSSTSTSPPDRHVQVADMVIEKAKAPGRARQGRGHSARLDHASGPRAQRRGPALRQDSLGWCGRERAAKAQALLRRRAQHRGGGSLTILATALIDTGSRMDEVIFEEFKGTGNSKSSSTAASPSAARSRPSTCNAPAHVRKRLLLTKEELNKVYLLRNFLFRHAARRGDRVSARAAQAHENEHGILPDDVQG